MRWNPKPSLCFQRKDWGQIIVTGCEVLQFNMRWQLVSRQMYVTFAQAVQQAMLLIGSSMAIDDMDASMGPGTDTGLLGNMNADDLDDDDVYFPEVADEVKKAE